MRTSFAAIAATAFVSVSAATAHAYSGRDTIALDEALAEFEPQILRGPTRDVGSLRSNNARMEVFKNHPFDFQASDVLPAGRKLLQDEVTASVTDPSPPNKTNTPYEIEQFCPAIKIGPALCPTGPWILIGGDVIYYNLTIPINATELALQVTLEPEAGNPNMLLFLVDPFGKGKLHDHSLQYSGHDIATIDASFLTPGMQVVIQVDAQQTQANFALTVDLFQEGRTVSPRDAKALAAISAACCQNDTCASPLLTQYATDQTVMNPCLSDGWYCNADGHLTHMILFNTGFQCKAIDLAPLSQMKALHLFALVSAPGVTGDINTFLSHFKDDHGLRVMELLQTGMTGMLPAKCPAGHQFEKLVRLRMEDMRISGHIPNCLMGLEELHIARTNIHESLPPIPADSPMRRLSLVQEADGKPRIKGDAAAIAKLTKLQSVELAYTDFRGTLTVGPELRSLTTVGLPFTAFAAGTQLRLQSAIMVDGGLSGPVPPELLNDSDLVMLVLRNNSLTHMDQDFDAMMLWWLDISHNQIEGTLPAAIGEQELLWSFIASHNKFSGPITQFTRQIAEGSWMHLFDISANQFTGPLSGLEPLGVFTRLDTLTVHPETGSLMPNILNVSANNFEGTLPLAYYADASSGGPDQLPYVMIDIRGNDLIECPDPDIQSPTVQVICDQDVDAAAMGGSGGRGAAATAAPLRDVTRGNEDNGVVVPVPSTPQQESPEGSGESALGTGAVAGIVVAVLAAVLIAAAVSAVALRRYKQHKQDAWTAATLNDGATTSADMAGYKDSALP